MTNKYTNNRNFRNLDENFSDMIDDILATQSRREGIPDDDTDIFDKWYDENWEEVVTAYMSALLPNISITMSWKVDDKEFTLVTNAPTIDNI